MMKIVTYILIGLLVAAIGAGAFFYLYTFKPIEADYKRMTAGMPDLEKAKAKVKQYEERDAKETAWIKPAVDALNTSLGDEIKAGQAEVVVAGGRVVVNIPEQAMFMTDSYTFSKESPKLLEKLASLLKSKEAKGKTVLIGNTTQAVSAQGKGRKKIPQKDARTLAADRSAALAKYLEKNGVEQDAFATVAYASKLPDSGFKLKDRKTMIIFENQISASPTSAPAAQTPASPAPATKVTGTAAAAQVKVQPKPIPILPAGQPSQK